MKYHFLLLLVIPVFCSAQQTSDERKWNAGVQGYYYFVPQETLAPTFVGTADINAWHLETRYNYEDINSASLFGGYTFSKADKLEINITPMAGFVFGNSDGFLPGLEFDAAYGKFYLYSENEYLLAFDSKQNNFLYSWTELNVETLKNLRAGILMQSLRLYKTPFDVQSGLYAEYSLGSFTFDLYYLNPFSSKYNYLTVGVSVDF